MDLDIVSSVARVHDLQRQVQKLTTENNWDGLFSTPGGKKNVVRFLVESVRPPSFRHYMKNVVNVSMPQLQQDPSAFFGVLKEKMKIFDEMNNMGNEMGIGGAKKKRHRVDPDRKNAHKKPRTADKSQKARHDIKCHKCGELGHFMSKCREKPSKDEQELLMKKHRAKASMNKWDNKHPKSTYVSVYSVGGSQYNDSISVDVKVADENLVFSGILDSGAEATIMPLKFARKILEIDNKVRMSRLGNPIVVQTPNGTTGQIHYEMLIDIVLQTKAGKLLVPSRRCLVWDTNNDVVLLGADLLNELGIDPKSALDVMISRTTGCVSEGLKTYSNAHLTSDRTLVTKFAMH